MTNTSALLKLSLALVACCFGTLLYGQRPGGPGGANLNFGRFYGKVVDETTGKGIGYASVQLTAMRFDSVSKTRKEVLITGQLTEHNGDFSLENLPIRGEYTLKIRYLGFASIEKKVAFGMPTDRNPGMGGIAVSFDKDLGNISLAATAEMLKEVTISEDASAVSLALDKKVYKVDKNGVAAGGTAEDALRQVPSIVVDLDGNVTMRNAAPQMFVDGRPTTLSIDQIPADAIESIEVITNPSAKYDASGGNGGILNIVLKKERRVGYNGSVRAGIDMRGKFNANADINARQGKINTFLSAGLNQRRSLGMGVTERENLFGQPRTNVTQVSHFDNQNQFFNTRAGIDWFVNNRNTLTFSGSYNQGQMDPSEAQDIRTDSLYAGGVTFSQAQRVTESSRMYSNVSGQILYKKLFTREGQEWTADVNYNQAHSKGEGLFNTSYLTSPLLTRQKQENDGDNLFFTAQSDYVTPLGRSRKLEAGARAAIRDYSSKNANYQFNFGDNAYVRVPGFADRYQFNDQVYAAYASFSQSFKKWGIQTGLRVESSKYKGTLLDSDSSFQNQYPLSAFPSVFATYKLNEEDNLQLSYTRRINRPNFFQLIPFPDFSDSLLLSRGNPGLRPEFTNAVELSYQNIFNKNHNVLFSVFYRQATDLITRYQFSEYNVQLGRQAIVSTFANSNQSQAYGLEVTFKNTVFKILDLTTNANFYNSIVDATNVEASLRTEQFTWFGKASANLRLPASFTFQLSGEYQSRTAFTIDQGGGGGGNRYGGGGGWGFRNSSTAQGYSIPNWVLDASIRKDLWKRTASITLSVQDFLRTRKQGSHSESAFFVQDTWRRRDPQFVRLNFSYRFGKFDVALFKRKNVKEGSEGMDQGF